MRSDNYAELTYTGKHLCIGRNRAHRRDILPRINYDQLADSALAGLSVH